MSTAFFITAGIERLCSGVTNTTAWAAFARLRNSVHDQAYVHTYPDDLVAAQDLVARNPARTA